MCLKKLLTDLSDNVELVGNQNVSGDIVESNFITLDDDYGLGNNGHTIIFNQRSMPWNDVWGVTGNKPLITWGFDSDTFEDLDNPPEGDDNATEIMRGGIGTNFYRRAVDFTRVGKWMFGTPAGGRWIFKQAGLQLMNPRLDAPQKSLIDSVVSGFTSVLITASSFILVCSWRTISGISSSVTSSKVILCIDLNDKFFGDKFSISNPRCALAIISFCVHNSPLQFSLEIIASG